MFVYWSWKLSCFSIFYIFHFRPLKAAPINGRRWLLARNASRFGSSELFTISDGSWSRRSHFFRWAPFFRSLWPLSWRSLIRTTADTQASYFNYPVIEATARVGLLLPVINTSRSPLRLSLLSMTRFLLESHFPSLFILYLFFQTVMIALVIFYLTSTSSFCFFSFSFFMYFQKFADWHLIGRSIIGCWWNRVKGDCLVRSRRKCKFFSSKILWVNNFRSLRG